MIGGLFKSSSRVALVAAAGLMYGGVSAQAADLGGNCCADLEERVAELEATTVRKGTRNVSLTVSGALAVNVMWHDSDSADAQLAGKTRISGNTGNDVPSTLTFAGTASINADLTAGFRMDFDVDDLDNATSVGVDDLFLFIRSNTYGRIAIGRVDQAMDGINAISLANIADIQLDNGGAVGIVGAGYFSTGDLDGTDDVGGAIRYDSPAVMGFTFSASYANDEPERPTGPDFDQADVWSVALRYAGEFGAFRVAAGIGYEEEFDNTDVSGALEQNSDRETLTGSISVMHTPTGLFLNFAAGTEQNAPRGIAQPIGNSNRDVTAYGIVGGIQQKWIAAGDTTLYGFVNFNEGDNVVLTQGDGATNVLLRDQDTVNWGLGVVQRIDAASMTLNMFYQNLECLDNRALDTNAAQQSCTSDANVVMFGAVMNF